jgi:pimeloyl-ACP methyl ester carboxylesterase
MFAAVALAALPAESGGIPSGKGEIEVAVNGTPISVYTYRPKDYTDGPLILVMHGILRNADEYRDHAVVLGDNFHALIAAPKFDEERFSKYRYQRAGILNEDGTALKPEERTGVFLPQIAEDIRRREQREKLPFYLIGHSAGGQFLARTSAFVATGAERIVAANPGTHLFPVTDAEFPLGFGGLPEDIDVEQQMRHYFAQPLTFFLGSGDIERDEYLDVSPESDAQGMNRFERGRNNFSAAKKLAAEKGWTFNWRLVIADGVEHDHEKMFAHPACKDALFGIP